MVREFVHRLRRTIAMLDPGALAVRSFRCPGCGPSMVVRLAGHSIGVRCLRCGASAITLSVMSVLFEIQTDKRIDAAYELSSRGPLIRFLRRSVRSLTCSEYFEDVPPGQQREGVLCQDVQRLTFADGSFDLCTSTEVFEHVPDDIRGFREIRRVLKPGGRFVFTVPMSGESATVERARLVNGQVEHVLPPEYHIDRIHTHDRVLAFRTYGRDITDRLRAAGFSDTTIDWRFRQAFLGHGSGVVMARA